MDFLKRSLAPISDEAWHEIDDVARDILITFLSARKIVDVSGPHGLDFASVSLGRLNISKDTPVEGVDYGVASVQAVLRVLPCEAVFWLFSHRAVRLHPSSCGRGSGYRPR